MQTIPKTEQQWRCQQIKTTLMKHHSENTYIRCLLLENCAKQCTFDVMEQLGFGNVLIDEYKTPIISPEQAERYLQWINEISLPNSYKKKILSFDSIEQKLRGRCNFLIATHFGDDLFPYLFNHCFDYAQYVANQIFYNNSNQLQKIQFLSILKKAYFLRALHCNVEGFRQAKPAPLICKRSLCDKSRALNVLLKQEFGVQSVKNMLEKKMINSTFDVFPKNISMAIDVVSELFKDEMEIYNLQFRNNNININLGLTNNISNSVDTTNIDIDTQNKKLLNPESNNHCDGDDIKQNIMIHKTNNNDGHEEYLHDNINNNVLLSAQNPFTDTEDSKNNILKIECDNNTSFSNDNNNNNNNNNNFESSHYHGSRGNEYSTCFQQRFDPMSCPCHMLKECKLMVNIMFEKLNYLNQNFESIMNGMQNGYNYNNEIENDNDIDNENNNQH